MEEEKEEKRKEKELFGYRWNTIYTLGTRNSGVRIFIALFSSANPCLSRPSPIFCITVFQRMRFDTNVFVQRTTVASCHPFSTSLPLSSNHSLYHPIVLLFVLPVSTLSILLSFSPLFPESLSRVPLCDWFFVFPNSSPILEILISRFLFSVSSSLFILLLFSLEHSIQLAYIGRQ